MVNTVLRSFKCAHLRGISPSEQPQQGHHLLPKRYYESGLSGGIRLSSALP
jgi:hypothetical protein